MARRMPPAKVSLPSPSPSPPNSAKPPTIMDMRRYQAIQLGTLAKPPMHAPIASTSKNPDDDTYNKAARLDDHACFRSLIATALQREWSPPRVYPQSDAKAVRPTKRRRPSSAGDLSFQAKSRRRVTQGTKELLDLSEQTQRNISRRHRKKIRS